MDPRTVRVATVAILTFIPWLITLAALETAAMFARPVFVAFHYLVIVLLYTVAFAWYYQGHKQAEPFTVMGTAVGCWLALEVGYSLFVYEGSLWFATYTDWIVPMFLMATTVYAVGRFVNN